MKRQSFLIVTAAILTLGFSPSVFGDDGSKSGVIPIQNQNQVFTTPEYRGDLNDRTTLSGDWGGTRQDLANNGITLDANLTQVTQGVVSGGIRTGWEYMGREQTTLNMDTAKMGLWPGGLLTVMGEGNYGNPLSGHTGSLLGTNVNELFPEKDNSFVVPQVSFTQFLSPKFGIALGKIPTVTDTAGDMNEFAHGVGNHQFLDTSLSFNPVLGLTVPYSTLALSTVFLPHKDLVVSATVLDPHGKADSAGLNTFFENGATLASEGRYTTHFWGKTGHQLLGATYSSSSYTDFDQSAANLIIPGLPIKQANHSWSGYWNADQYFYQPDPAIDHGVGVFTRFGLSDGKANPIQDVLNFGVGGKGIIPGRENDGFGLGYYYIWAADTDITSTAGFGDAQGVEAYYEAALTPALFLSPDIQWTQPSQQRVDSSLVLGLRLYAVF